jgi:hypothetical protein
VDLLGVGHATRRRRVELCPADGLDRAGCHRDPLISADLLSSTTLASSVAWAAGCPWRRDQIASAARAPSVGVIADPDLPAKVGNGRAGEIRVCVGLSECHHRGGFDVRVTGGERGACGISPSVIVRAGMHRIPAVAVGDLLEQVAFNYRAVSSRRARDSARPSRRALLAASRTRACSQVARGCW